MVGGQLDHLTNLISPHLHPAVTRSPDFKVSPEIYPLGIQLENVFSVFLTI